MMKKITSIITLFLFALLSVCAQTTLVNFDDISYSQGGWNGIGEVVTNPDTEGINTSANVCKYTIPANKAWSNCAWVIFDNVIQYADLDYIEFMVKAPSATQMFVKLENENIDGEAQPSTYATPIDSEEWQVIRLTFSGLTEEQAADATFNKLAFFFNVNDGSGGEEWYYDNVVSVLKTTTGINTSDINTAVFPNPVQDYLSISGDVKVLLAEIYNVSGALMNKVQISPESQQIFMGDYENGVYFVKVTNENSELKTFKVIKH